MPIRPAQLAHVVFYTNDLPSMVGWYTTVLHADATFANDSIAFLIFDDEHHRVSIVAVEAYAERGTAKIVGFYHAAFTYRSLSELIATYERLAGAGIEAFRTFITARRSRCTTATQTPTPSCSRSTPLKTRKALGSGCLESPSCATRSAWSWT